jgi:hypothetical protein
MSRIGKSALDALLGKMAEKTVWPQTLAMLAMLLFDRAQEQFRQGDTETEFREKSHRQHRHVAM